MIQQNLESYPVCYDKQQVSRAKSWGFIDSSNGCMK